MKDHRVVDARSLAWSEQIAAKLAADPALMRGARENLARWLITCAPATRAVLIEWEQLLSEPLEKVTAVLIDPGEASARLRQSSPFAGVLSAGERAAILMDFERRESGTT